MHLYGKMAIPLHLIRTKKNKSQETEAKVMPFPCPTSNKKKDTTITCAKKQLCKKTELLFNE